MEYVNYRGRHVRCRCARCSRDVWTPVLERQIDPAPVICSECQHFLSTNPDVAEREFQADLRRSQQDSIDMRARWARQDAAKKRHVA